jgi:hypothetical protein
MASPNTTFTSGAILTAAQMNNLPFGLMGTPVRKTTSQSGFSTIADVTSMTLTFTGIANRWYRATYTAQALASVAGTTFRFTLTDSANNVVTGGIYDKCFVNTNSDQVVAQFYFQQTGNALRKIRCVFQAGGGGTLNLYADASIPATFVIEDIGSV